MYIVFYLVLVTLVMFFISNSEFQMFDMTEGQITAMENPSNDVPTLVNKLLVLSSIDSSFATLSVLMGILGIVFIITIAVVINEFIPFT